MSTKSVQVPPLKCKKLTVRRLGSGLAFCLSDLPALDSCLRLSRMVAGQREVSDERKSKRAKGKT